jgi:hypothetical protein
MSIIFNFTANLLILIPFGYLLYNLILIREHFDPFYFYGFYGLAVLGLVGSLINFRLGFFYLLISFLSYSYFYDPNVYNLWAVGGLILLISRERVKEKVVDIPEEKINKVEVKRDKPKKKINKVEVKRDKPEEKINKVEVEKSKVVENVVEKPRDDYWKKYEGKKVVDKVEDYWARYDAKRETKLIKIKKKFNKLFGIK